MGIAKTHLEIAKTHLEIAKTRLEIAKTRLEIAKTCLEIAKTDSKKVTVLKLCKFRHLRPTGWSTRTAQIYQVIAHKLQKTGSWAVSLMKEY